MTNEQTSFTSWQQGRITTAAALNNEQQVRNNINSIKTELEEIIASANRIDNLLSAFHETAHIKNAVAAIENVNAAIIARGRQPAFRYYTVGSSDLQRSLAARRDEIDRGRAFLNGQQRNSDGIVVTDRYPSEALEVLNTLLAAINEDINRATTMVTSYRNEPAAIILDEEIASLNAASQTALNELNTLRNQAQTLAQTARSQSSLAEAHRQEAERLLREAQAAFQRRNYDSARDLLERSRGRFNNSLEIQANDALRRSSDAQLLSLGQSINTAENETIIVEVRNLVNNARTAYFEGRFQQAEDSLVRARNRWRITNSEENEEIIYWLGITRGAMSATSGRVISSTAPLYPEMSQLLSQARKSYEEGVRFINAGNRSQGIAKFNEARLKTREVKLMFPLNQEAGILELRMEQYTDAAAFNASFEQRLRTAIAGTKRRSFESFADLQNLAEINPNYPGMRGIVNQAEIDMGIRPPPPDPKDLERSRELTASANRILEANNTALFEVALSQINEAITLNPQNMEATRVKDRLLNRMSVPGAIVLTSEDEAEYQRALRELQAGNTLIARAIVERLLQNPRNKNITKLVELQRRIQLSL
jgi:hypothetical protein